MTELLVWHFLPADGCIANEGTLVVPGQTLRLPDSAQPKLCDAGYHGSVRAIDALGYASGAIVERAVLSGDVLQGTDKVCASERTCIAVADATTVLFEFACWSAERALMCERDAGREPDVRSWAVVAARRAWLRGEITDAQLAVAARAAAAAYAVAYAAATAYAAARDVAYAAAQDAAWSAARDAAYAAARDAAYAAYAAAYAAYAAAYATAKDAAYAAAKDAAYAAAWSAAQDAAWSAARDAAWSAAQDAERAAQNAELEARLCVLLGVAA